jgi:hypothetical protein
MTHRSIAYGFSCAVVGTALLMTAYTGSAWGLSVLGMLFVFVLFPRWRTKAYRLAWRIVGSKNHDSCDSDK